MTERPNRGGLFQFNDRWFVAQREPTVRTVRVADGAQQGLADLPRFAQVEFALRAEDTELVAHDLVAVAPESLPDYRHRFLRSNIGAYVTDEAFIRRVLLEPEFKVFMDGVSRYYLNRIIAAAHEEGRLSALRGHRVEVLSATDEGVVTIRETVQGQAAETTAITITVSDPTPEPEPEGEGLYDIDVTWTSRDQWTIRASSADEALEIAKEQGFDAVEDYTHDQYPEAEYGVPERRED
ncbi:hypothetical protein MARCHEWKA_01820 [Brevundimonas phage vB_BpoS-Marchewka]|uniref:Uncharacterized protein n=1 Tax=Brevundimonas phage vB_BpoS-Marchewka TaxID=2948604 RepID=A0A9E7N444_9CAUD|nr:hypothetical protein MARCHEWKA_01820 [Brevundimonas phage vB_BpoS-Marchewka]